MHDTGVYGLPGPTRVKRLRGIVTADDLVNRKFHRAGPNELWVTEHPKSVALDRHTKFTIASKGLLSIRSTRLLIQRPSVVARAVNILANLVLVTNTEPDPR